MKVLFFILAQLVIAHPGHEKKIYSSKNRVSKTEKMQYRLTRCLGREELRIHKAEKEDYHYFLNQTLISYLIGIEGATISDSIYYSVCQKNRKYLSLDLFMELLKKGKKAFKLLPNKNISTNSSIDRFVNDLYKITNSFFLHTQKNAPDKKCLEKYTPELLAIQDDMLYLLGEVELNKILFKKNRMQSLISKIRDPFYYQKKCSEDKKDDKETK